MLTRFALAVGLLCCVGLGPVAAAEWKPQAGPLLTRWAKEIDPAKVHAEYPRPQLVRSAWQNLNGLWDYAVHPAGEAQPKEWQGSILVPFPIESALSGVMKRVDAQERLWYRRTFELPNNAAWTNRRVRLHFGAVDWQTTVWVNGREVGQHTGGYDPFWFDITEALAANKQGPHTIVVGVLDPTDANWQPRGKQIARPHGIWYTPTTGIWQTVWLEPVPERNITSLKLTPDIDAGQLKIVVHSASQNAKVTAYILLRGAGSAPTGPAHGLDAAEAVTHGVTNVEFALSVKNARLWSPETPHLYELRVTLDAGEKIVDSVDSYFGMRKIALGKDDKGVTRIVLNNKPYFNFGPLDQGFWPDGLYTAPSDAALKYDIEATKQMGFNTARKHVKVEPARWYYWCDRLGLLVWQDMPSGDRYIGANDPDIQRSPESTANFEREWKSIMDALRNAPSIVMWVPFNEGWGQFDTARIVELTKRHDPSRLVNNASGWSDRGVGDVMDIHVYPGPAAPKNEEHRAAVLGEYGGLGLPVEGHTWQAKDNWGYRSFKTPEELTAAYEQNASKLPRLIADGLSAAIYTQTTDVEIEVNGLLTYDRAVSKIEATRLAEINRRVYLPPPEIRTVVATSQAAPVEWQFTLEKPADGWEQPAFDAAKWKTAPAGFGEESTPGTRVRTSWKTDDIWLRRTFELPANVNVKQLALIMHHDEDAHVFLNGVAAVQTSGYVTDYDVFRLSPAALAALKPGEKNLLAIHCRQTGGGQYIDAGLVEIVEGKK